MHERERWQLILAQVRQRGVIRVRDLVNATGASSATIRRDLTKLMEMGQINRIHGGIEMREMPEQPHLATRAFGVSQGLNVAKKRAVAAAAAQLCNDGESIILNAGSTMWYMAEFLRQKQLQILTNSFPIAQELIATSNNRIILAGGEVYREQGIILSPFDEDAIQQFTASKMFMSCSSITSMGVIEGDPLVTRSETKLLSRADKLIVVADSSKFEPRGSMVVCKFSRVHTLITDEGAPAELLKHIRDQGVEVIIAQEDMNSTATKKFSVA
ncbi:DeoR/GlpR family DNA-binding transcription regulator [Aestuariivirga litoralis]|uniref:DeoR/GlpR family DNA-binding transcription regulator n=1 Tax=Aestuariivirga litoralis TaxID=2650924 RepID=UPI0018C48B50|nr:DeoR/GlpR family DNA-binding transcription regulator [Aestuariivirga litoralis]MBG1232907.1 DeoR/GlpR transcriptional regulator [Aestuariivirga litoralis]